MSTESLNEQLARHRATFIASLPARREALEQAIDASSKGDAVAHRSIQALLHRIAGSAGVHGLDALSSAALAALTRVGTEADTASILGWPELAALRAALDAAGSDTP